jgi:hypothetical protein
MTHVGSQRHSRKKIFVCSSCVEYWLRDHGFDSHQKTRDIFVYKTCKSILELTHPNLKMGTAVSFSGDKSMGA